MSKIKMCSRINSCYKVNMILDKQFDIAELYPMLIKKVCRKCEEDK